MAKEINVKKIISELQKGTPDQQYTALQEIKNHVSKVVADEQKKLEDLASALQSKLEKI